MARIRRARRVSLRVIALLRATHLSERSTVTVTVHTVSSTGLSALSHASAVAPLTTVMESPTVTLSRTPSQTFSPGPHRRSHPNLQHLSLVPLTPKFPVGPADYDAYFDPQTSQLHTSSSLSHIAGLPSPGGILTNSPARSRASSHNRLNAKRKTKSTVSFQNLPEELVMSKTTPSGALNNAELDQKKANRSNMRLQMPPNPHTPRNDSSWLIQTGLVLTESARENKGQSWIVKRDSSVNLHNLSPDRARSPYASGRNTPNRSRRGSRAKRSKRDLAMTPAEENVSIASNVKPDWADVQTQAEFASEIFQNEVSREGSTSSKDEWFRDRYGMLDFTGNFQQENENDDDNDEEDDEEALEKSVRDEIRRRKGGFLFGRWFDGMVDVLLQLEDEPFRDGEADRKPVQLENKNGEEEKVMEVKEDELDAVPELETETETETETLEPPPDHPTSVWEDLNWFGRVVARTLQE